MQGTGTLLCDASFAHNCTCMVSVSIEDCSLVFHNICVHCLPAQQQQCDVGCAHNQKTNDHLQLCNMLSGSLNRRHTNNAKAHHHTTKIADYQC